MFPSWAIENSVDLYVLSIDFRNAEVICLSFCFFRYNQCIKSSQDRNHQDKGTNIVDEG